MNEGKLPFPAVDDDRLGLINAFVAVMELRSFSAAAGKLGQTSSTISRKISRLEEELGARLLNRTTRKVMPTEAGALYHKHCLTVLELIGEADANVASITKVPRGQLRISMPVAFGHLHMTSLLAEFLALYPQISIDAAFNDRFVDMVAENFDLAIRIGNLPDSSLIARKLTANRRILVASPAYLGAYGEPTAPEDLGHHDCIRYNLYRSSGNIWRFRRGNTETSVPVSGSFRCDNSEAVNELAIKGLGIGVVAEYICHRDLALGRLKALLPDWTLEPPSNIYVCYPSTRLLMPKVRLLVDFLAERFTGWTWLEAGEEPGSAAGHQ